MERNAFIYRVECLEYMEREEKRRAKALLPKKKKRKQNDKKFNDKMRSKTNFPIFYYDYLFRHCSFLSIIKYAIFFPSW